MLEPLPLQRLLKEEFSWIRLQDVPFTCNPGIVWVVEGLHCFQSFRRRGLGLIELLILAHGVLDDGSLVFLAQSYWNPPGHTSGYSTQ